MSLRVRSPQLREYLEEKLDQLTYDADAGTYTIDADLVVTGTITQDAAAVVINTSYLGTLTVGVNDTGYDVKFYGATSGVYWLWDEDADGVVQLAGLTVGANTNGFDVKFYGNTTSKYWLWDESEDEMVIKGNADITGTVTIVGATSITGALTQAGNVAITGTLDVVGAVTVGVNETGHDVKLYGTTDGSYLLWDESGDLLVLEGADLKLNDGDNLQFGDAPDVQIRWDGTDLDVLATVDGTILKFGNGTQDFDIWIYGGASTVVFNEGDAEVVFDGYDIKLSDDDFLIFGDGDDITINWDPDSFDIEAAGNGIAMTIGATSHLINLTLTGTFTVGVDNTGHDVKFFGATSGSYVLWDESDDRLEFVNSYVELGTSGSPTALTYDGKKILGIYSTCASTNAGISYEPVVINTVMTGAGQVGGRVRINMESDVVLGAWANALKVSVDWKDNGGTSGLGSAICAEMTMPASENTGTLTALECELTWPESATEGNLGATSFILMNASGAAVGEFDDYGALISIQGLSADTGHLISANTAGETTLDFANWKKIRIMIGNEEYFLVAAKSISATS